MNPDLKRLDMHIIQFLSTEPGTRNVRANIAHELIDQIEDDLPDDGTDDYLHEVEVFARRVSNRLDRGLMSRGLVRRVGPSDKSGLYELTSQGQQAARILDNWDIDDDRDRTYARYDVDEYLGLHE